MQQKPVITVYCKLVTDTNLMKKKWEKWKATLGKEIPFNQFLVTFKEIKHLTNITKYRSFQYRLQQRAIVTNIQLKKWKIIGTAACSLCNEQDETYIHLFIECPCVKELWIKLEQFMLQYGDESIDFQIDKVLWSRIIATPIGHIKNFMSLVAKHYIYKQCCFNKPIKFEELKSTIIGLKKIERYYAMRSNKLNKHCKKWNISIDESFE